MGRYFDEPAWRAEVRKPDWYLRLRAEYESLLAQARASDPATARSIATDVYSFFETALAEGSIAVGTADHEWDTERRPIDTVVIHHTRLPSGITWQRLDAIHLTRVYARYYANPIPAELSVRGQPISSGHRREDREVFYAYHWLVRADGTAERLLADRETGWHAGDWEVNCRSVGICLDANLEHERPTAGLLDGLIAVIREAYPDVISKRIVGHGEINRDTTCPGEPFLSDWKSDVIQAVASGRE